MLGAALLVTLLVYLRCLGNGFVLDDRWMTVRNSYIGQWSFLWKSLVHDEFWFNDPLHLPQSSRYRPLLSIWAGLQYHLFGFNPVGWHATIVVFNLAAVWMVFKLAAFLTSDGQAALLASLLFGLLPVHAHAVAWVSARGLPLSATFEMAAFYLFARRAASRRRNWMLALGLYAAALLSHESAAAFPALVGLYVLLQEPSGAAGTADPTPAPGWPRVRKALVCMAPFAVETLLYLAVRWHVPGFLEQPLASGFINRGGHLATTARVLITLPWVLASYLALLVMPWLAGPCHPAPVVASPLASDFYLPVAALIVSAAALLFGLQDHPRRRLYLFCAGWVGVAIAPMMNLPAIFEIVQDSYLYLPSVGLCVMAADLAVRQTHRVASARRLVWGGAAALLVLNAAELWRVQRFWHDEVALFARCADNFPNWAIWHVQLATALGKRGDLAHAEAELKKALSLEPEDGVTLYNLGLLHARLGHTKQAATEVAQAVKRWLGAPGSAYILLAELYDSDGDQTQSEAALRHTESMPGGAQTAGLARARIRMAHGDAAGSETILRNLTDRYPVDPFVWDNLGLAMAAQNRNEQALSAYSRALKLAPARPATHLFAAQALHALNRDGEALDQCRQALAIQPAYPEATALMAEIARGPTRR